MLKSGLILKFPIPVKSLNETETLIFIVPFVSKTALIDFI